MCKTMKQLNQNVLNRRSLKAQIEKLKAELEACEKEIYDYADAHGVSEITGATYKIKISNCERRTLDAKRLEADLGSLAEYEKVTQYRRLYVS